MIILAQTKNMSGMWDDMRIPRDGTVPPVRGERPYVTSVKMLAKQLQRAGLAGEYRVVHVSDDLKRETTIWSIKITREDNYVAVIELEKPA